MSMNTPRRWTRQVWRRKQFCGINRRRSSKSGYNFDCLRLPDGKEYLMRIVRMGVLALCLGIVGLCPAVGQETGHAAPTAQAQTTPGQQAYHLPPEKLAKAIALNRIRNIEHFVD